MLESIHDEVLGKILKIDQNQTTEDFLEFGQCNQAEKMRINMANKKG